MTDEEIKLIAERMGWELEHNADWYGPTYISIIDDYREPEIERACKPRNEAWSLSDAGAFQVMVEMFRSASFHMDTRGKERVFYITDWSGTEPVDYICQEGARPWFYPIEAIEQAALAILNSDPPKPR